MKTSIHSSLYIMQQSCQLKISTVNIEKPRLIETIFGIVYNGNSVSFVYNFVNM